MYTLFSYNGYPIWNHCKQIDRNISAKKLMEKTEGKGHKFFINHNGGTYYSKSIYQSEKWERINDSIPIPPYTI